MVRVDGELMTLPNGIQVELFPIGVLAQNLGRTTQTVRKWEISGVLPRTLFKNSMGTRLYTKDQIKIIVEEAERCQISAGSGYSLSKFKDRVAKRLTRINKKYAKNSLEGDAYEG